MQQANIYLFCNVYLYNKRQKSLKIRAKNTFFNKMSFETFMKMYRFVFKHFFNWVSVIKKGKEAGRGLEQRKILDKKHFDLIGGYVVKFLLF